LSPTRLRFDGSPFALSQAKDAGSVQSGKLHKVLEQEHVANAPLATAGTTLAITTVTETVTEIVE
jgi:hypothetical protein